MFPLASRRQIGGLGQAGGGGDAVAYSISGIVYDADGTTTIAGATVALGAFSAVSAANGTYTISDIPADTSGSMTSTKSGYKWAEKIIAAMTGNLTAQNYIGAWYTFGGNMAHAVGVYQAIGAADLASSYINLISPGTYNITQVVADPAFVQATGWDFDGSQALDTHIVPIIAQDTSIIVRFSNGGASGALIGSNTGSNYIIIQPNTSSLVRYWNGQAPLGVAPALTSGVVGIGGGKGYRNTIQDSGDIPVWLAGSSTISLYTGAYHDAGGAQQKYTGKIQGVAIYDVALSSTDMLGIMAALAALTGSSVPY